MVAETRRRFGREDCAEHVGSGRHRILGRSPFREWIRAGATGNSDELLGGGVVRLELVIVDRPVDDVGAFDGAELGTSAEVDGAQPRELPVGVEAAPTDG